MHTISLQHWRKPTSDSEAHRRAGGRRRYNLQRTIIRERRLVQVAALLNRYGLFRTNARIGRDLAVSRATICRDRALLLRLAANSPGSFLARSDAASRRESRHEKDIGDADSIGFYSFPRSHGEIV